MANLGQVQRVLEVIPVSNTAAEAAALDDLRNEVEAKGKESLETVEA